jgi:hypothetical protein
MANVRRRSRRMRNRDYTCFLEEISLVGPGRGIIIAGMVRFTQTITKGGPYGSVTGKHDKDGGN